MSYINGGTFRNCTFIDNSAQYSAGAISGYNKDVVNCTFINNLVK